MKAESNGLQQHAADFFILFIIQLKQPSQA